MRGRNYDKTDEAAQEADDHWTEHGDAPAADDGVSYEEATLLPAHLCPQSQARR